VWHASCISMTQLIHHINSHVWHGSVLWATHRCSTQHTFIRVTCDMPPHAPPNQSASSRNHIAADNGFGKSNFVRACCTRDMTDSSHINSNVWHRFVLWATRYCSVLHAYSCVGHVYVCHDSFTSVTRDCIMSHASLQHAAHIFMCGACIRVP